MKHLLKNRFLLIYNFVRFKIIPFLFLISLIALNLIITSNILIGQNMSSISYFAKEDVYAMILSRKLDRISGTQRINLNIKDTRLLYVEFYIDTALVFVDKEAPWEYVHDFGLIEKVHEVRIIGYFKEKEVSQLKTKGRKKQLINEEGIEKYKITITSPQANSSVVGEVEIKAKVSTTPDAVVEKVEFYIDQALLFTDKKAPYTFKCNVGKQFNHRVIEVVSYDSKGRKKSDAIIIKDLRGDVYKAKVDLVNLEVTVKDKEDNYVYGLRQDDFIVYEDGKRQEISHFIGKGKPLAIGILIDTSASMLNLKLDKAKVGAKKFINTLRKNDQAFIMSFYDKINIEQNFTNSIVALKGSIDHMTASGATALNNAVFQAIKKLKEEKGRKAIILLSDGYDTVRELNEEEVLEAAKRADVQIYSIGIFTQSFISSKQKQHLYKVLRHKPFGEVALKSFADWTGGKAYFPSSLSELDNIYISISQELRQQYSLGYCSTNKRRDGKWRKIEVKLNNDKLKVRTRKGYYAPLH